jgi:hypothetical protein
MKIYLLNYPWKTRLNKTGENGDLVCASQNNLLELAPLSSPDGSSQHSPLVVETQFPSEYISERSLKDGKNQLLRT